MPAIKNKEALNPEDVASLSEVTYPMACSIFIYLLENGWGIRGWSTKEPKAILQFISPDGESMYPNATLYYVVTGNNPGNKNTHTLMKEEGFNMRLFEKFYYMSGHMKHQSRIDFIRDVVEESVRRSLPLY